MAGPRSTVPDDRGAAVRGRLAPSPTGLLHLGNAWAFLMAWLLCRQRQGCLVLRMEDIDPARSRPEFAAAAIEDLHWLGLDWDEGPDEQDPLGMGGPHAPYTQSLRGTEYAACLERLERAGRTYPCFCTRKELRALAGAPHVGDEGVPYPGTCRGLDQQTRRRLEAQGRRAAIRLVCPPETFAFEDLILGPQCMTLAECGGDFALQRSDKVVAYQLAVAVDDGLMRINQVVRGRDILSSTPRQMLLQRMLDFPTPGYAHLPLIRDAEGERLAKRHGGLTLRALREGGVTPDQVIGYLAFKAGLVTGLCRITAKELLSALPHHLPIWWRERDIRLDPAPEAAIRAIA